ncbi:MAG: NAD-dependent epimerase/dehydratase family protein [Promethearchaeota archaeon]
MFVEGKNILVTGAAGFIGSNLTDELLKLGTNVIGIDNLYNGSLDNLERALKNKNFRFYKTDIRDFNYLLEISKEIDIIYHQAAFTSVPQSILMPDSCNNVNVNGTLNILNIARKNDIDKVIFASSSSVYGNISTLPLNEDMKLRPISPYGVSKLTCEAYMEAFRYIYGLRTNILRYFNVYGPRQKDSPYSGVIAIWLGKIIRNEDLIVFGDGKNSRDFTYIKDVIQANLLAAEKDFSGEVFNIGAGCPINLTELANLMIKITNKQNLKIIYTDPRPGDISNSYADISKAKQLLHFKPKYNQESGLKDYLEWYKRKNAINIE